MHANLRVSENCSMARGYICTRSKVANTILHLNYQICSTAYPFTFDKMYSVGNDSILTNGTLLETVELCDFISSPNFRLPSPAEYIKDRILLGKKNVCFNFEEKESKQTNGVAMESLLGSALACVLQV